MNIRIASIEQHPQFPWLSEHGPETLQRVLRHLGVLDPADCVCSCARAGEGNMNLTLRVVTGRETGKQAVYCYGPLQTLKETILNRLAARP
jgi:hypothetical protein